MKNTITPEHITKLFNEADLTEQVVFNKCLIVSIKLRNGFIITESSACVDPANFDMEIGRRICCDRIKDKLWELEGYRLQYTIHERIATPLQKA